MKVVSAKFVSSKLRLEDLPPAELPEFAFIGRSNVGKSSLINYLTNRASLAKTSATPGKTQTINHYLINQRFYFVDLPGYGYAKVPLSVRKNFEKAIREYLLKRQTLFCLMVLIDIRHEPLNLDKEFISWLGENQVPFCIVFTKADKLSPAQIEKRLDGYRAYLAESWEVIPPFFVTSAEKKTGADELLAFIEQSLLAFNF